MRALLRLLCATCLWAAASLALAQGFPSRGVRIIVPFPAGGTTDILARQLAVELAAKWGQTVVVDNKGGASGQIGSEQLVASAPDGHTLMLTATHHVINPGLYKKLKYDTARDFTNIALIAAVPNVLLVHPSVAAKTVQDLIGLAKARPGSLSFGSSGTGGANHLAGELFKAQAGIDMQHIPYKGAAPALNDLLGGQIPVMFDSLPGVIQHVRAGKLRALGVTSLKRAAAAPEVPTIDESGVKGFDATAWFGFYAPGNMAADLARRLNADVVAALATPKLKALFAEQGADPGTLNQAEFARFVADEMVKWGRVISTANVKAE